MHQVEILAEYTANLIYKPGRVHFAPDALLQIPTINAIGKPQSLLEAVCQAQNTSIDQEFLGFKGLENNPNSDVMVNQGLIVKSAQDNSPIIIPGDASQLKQTIINEIHTSPLREHIS